MSEQNTKPDGSMSRLVLPQTAPSGAQRKNPAYIQTGVSSASTRRSSRRQSQFPTDRMLLARQSVYSGSETSAQLPKQSLDNTYQLGPTTEQQFKCSEIHQIMKGILEVGIEDHVYHEKETPRLACILTQRIQDAVKRLQTCKRHKLCCHVVIGQNQRQGIHMSSKCVWAPDTDSSTTVSVSNAALFAVATTYGLYYE